MTMLRRLSCPLGRLGGSVATHNTVGDRRNGAHTGGPKEKEVQHHGSRSGVPFDKRGGEARRHHNTDTCELGRNIPEDERRARVQATTNCARTARKPRRDVRGTRSLTRALTDGGLV
jgi:hypothetical protein